MNSESSINILISRFELGAGTRGSSMGFDALLTEARNSELTVFEDNEYRIIANSNLSSEQYKDASVEHLEEFVPHYEILCNALGESLLNKKRTLLISGDHSNAGGWASALRNTYPNEKCGLIWIDAHGDIHTPYTSPSGNVHGMPIGALLALDNAKNKVREPEVFIQKTWDKLKLTGSLGISPKFNPEDIYYIDIRDLEEEEWSIIKNLKIPHFTPEDRKEKGIRHIISSVVDYFKNYDHIYVSFDVDSLDKELVPGTGTPVENGLQLEEAIEICKAFWNLPNTRVLEFTEINPLLDIKNRVAKNVVEILKSLKL